MATTSFRSCCSMFLLMFVAEPCFVFSQVDFINNDDGVSMRNMADQLRQVIASLQQLAQDNTQLKTDLTDIKSTVRHFTRLPQEMADVKLQFQQLTDDIASSQRNISNQLSDYCSKASKPRDCNDIKNLGSTSSGVYMVYVGAMQRTLQVFCDMTTDNGGWTVFQRRKDGSENFLRNWVDYANGFGNLSAEFWLGNNNIHALTNDRREYTLRVDLAHFTDGIRFAEYNNFKVDSSSNKYALRSLGTYSGTAGDSLSGHVGMMFSTQDQDNDQWSNNCAQTFKGAWWYQNCHYSNLNGYYYGGPHASYADGVNWEHWTGYHYSLKNTEMKIRPNSD